MCDTLYSKPALTPALLRAILDHSDELISREDFVWEIFVRNNHDRLSSIIRLGTEPLKPEERSSLLSVLSEHPKGLEIRSHTIEGDAREHGLFGKPPRMGAEIQTRGGGDRCEERRCNQSPLRCRGRLSMGNARSRAVVVEEVVENW